MPRLFRTLTLLVLLATISSPSIAQNVKPTKSEFRTLPGFEVELIHKVEKDSEGSWVALCVDPKGRLITSDQYGKLYRVTLGSGSDRAKIEQLKVDIGMAQGLLCAYDSLYININGKGRIAEGYDADFTIVDLKRRETITNKWMESRAGWTPYDGVKVQGWVTGTFVRGHLAMWQGELAAKAFGEGNEIFAF